jgi:hypothetical protein
VSYGEETRVTRSRKHSFMVCPRCGRDVAYSRFRTADPGLRGAVRVLYPHKATTAPEEEQWCMAGPPRDREIFRDRVTGEWR